MSKANGRGRGWARKGWSNLSKSTQQKYQRQGIDATRYSQGYQRGWIDQFAKDQEKFYGRDADEVKEELRGYDRAKVIDAIKDQRDMQALYAAGLMDEAHTIWEGRDQDLPEWMTTYHSYFA